MKDLCLRCQKWKNGVHSVDILGSPYKLCNYCSTRVSNLLDLWKRSKNEKYRLKLVDLMFHCKGFPKFC